MGSQAAAARPARGAGGQVATGVLLPAIAAAIALASARVALPAGHSALDIVGICLLLTWAVATAITTRTAAAALRWPLAGGVLAGAVALTASRLAGQLPPPGQQRLAAGVAALAVTLVIAASCHVLLAFPDGRLRGRATRAGIAAAYLAAAGTGLILALTGTPVPAMAIALAWVAVLAGAMPVARRKYARAGARDRERLQWLAIGLVLAADVALFGVVLHVLLDWPGAVAAVAAAATVAVPISLVAGGSRQLGPHGGRVLVHVLAMSGFSLVVSAVYLIVVLGLGPPPTNGDDREILGLSMLAAVVAAIGYLPSRDRLTASATRFVYGAREAPDEVLRTFGSRLTRAVAMDELLLQLAESLRRTMSLTSAQVYTGSGDVLERAVSVPDTSRPPILLTDRERPVVTRAGVSGSAWAAVWLPALLAGREGAQLRVAPISHGGSLLGLIVVERPADADGFSAEEDMVLADLARQAGLAFHNMRLDAALQTTLDELRKQAAELRESRARIVVTADAERRRVERDLHDGAQQHLVALAVNLRLTRDIIADDLAGGQEMLAQLAQDVQVTISELRELAHGIYPPLLADTGLAEALRAAAVRCTIPVSVDADGIGRYSQGIETAIYFCCLEAMQNAAKHAPQATARVRIWTESGGLLFSVSDDGPGFSQERARSGHGFVNMADRLGAVGGTVRWESEPGHGATISGSIPVA
jgi:signal transduction histidine kinase